MYKKLDILILEKGRQKESSYMDICFKCHYLNKLCTLLSPYFHPRDLWLRGKGILIGRLQGRVQSGPGEAAAFEVDWIHRLDSHWDPVAGQEATGTC